MVEWGFWRATTDDDEHYLRYSPPTARTDGWVGWCDAASPMMRQTMLTTKRKPATIGEILVEETMQPMGLTQAALAEAMGVQGKHFNELCNDRRTVTAATALILARVFGNSPEFWLTVQRRSDLWEAMNSRCERQRIEREATRCRGVISVTGKGKVGLA
jgi:antitoxin HigA-1